MQDVPQRRGPKPTSKNLLNDVFFKYLPYWPLFVITLMIALPAGWLYLRRAIPQYETSASIMLKDESKGAYGGAGIEAIDKISDKKIIENELKVLQSRTLMQDVVTKLHLYASFFEEGDLVALPAYVTSPVTIEAVDPDGLKSAGKVPFTYNEKDSTVSMGGKSYALNQFAETDYGKLRFVRNKNFMYKAQKPLFFSITKAKMAAESLGGIKAILSRESTVIALSYTNPDPKRGEDILNELIRAYDRANVGEKNKLAANTEAFMRIRLDSVQKEIDAINQRKQSYKASTGAINTGEQGALFLKSVNENDQKMSEVSMQLSVLNQVEKYVKSKDNTGGIVPSTLGVKDGMLSKLVEDLYDTEMNYEKLKKTSGENNPITTSVKDKMDRMRPGILENINNQRNNLEASRANLSSSNSVYTSMLSTIPQKERDLIDIDRELTIKLGIYNFLRQRLEESALASQNDIASGARIVDPAQSTPFPVSPNGKMIYIVAFVFGLGLPAAFIAAKEMLNRKVLFRAEIEKLTSVPIIGEVIHDVSKTPLVILEGKRTFIAEQFRRIRTSLSYLGLNSQKKKILITSSLSGEGKSFVAANLALSLALAGKKVVLLEFDLANPSLSNKLGVSYETGASTYLWGEAEPEEIIRRTSVNENLFFIPSGPLPENPSELLMSDRVKELLEYLDAIFDTVIIDSAPAGLLSDAYVLSPMCDATLYVVKHKYTPKLHLEKLDEENSVNQLKNLGIIFNGIRSRGFTKNGYGYGYGYGYIQNHKGKKKKKKEQY
jgi:tyrosine-protein kinase Etk/Wzc